MICWRDKVAEITEQNKKALQADEQGGLDGEPASGVAPFDWNAKVACSECGKMITQKEGFDSENEEGKPRCAVCAARDEGPDTQAVSVDPEQFLEEFPKST